MDSATRRVRTLGHGGALMVLAGLPAAALILYLVGHALAPHFVATTTLTAQAEAACFDQPPPGVPRYLPNGYRFVTQFRGSYMGPVGDNDEVTWVYNRTCTDPSALYPVLIFHVRVPGGTLALTEPARRHPVALGGHGVTAVYFDGWTTPEARVDSPLQVPVPHWETPQANALVVSWPGGTYGILGARDNGIGRGQLVTIARELPMAVAAPCRSCG